MTDKLHPLLLKQMKRAGMVFAHENLPDPVLSLLQRVSNTYHDFEAGHYTTVRSLEISSQEMFELRQKLQKEKDIIQAVMSDGLCVFDHNWNVVGLNKMGATLLFTTTNETLGKHYTDVFTLYKGDGAESELITLSSLNESLISGEVYQCDQGYIKSKLGMITLVSFSINPLPPVEGKFEGAVFVFRSIKEALEKELALKSAVKLAEKSNQAKTIFLANMSHEIRTPMNGVMGMLQLVMNTPLNEKQKNYIDKCYESAMALLRILGDILDFSKIESGKVSFENIEFSLKEEINSMMISYRAQCEQKKLSLEENFDKNIPELIKGDPHRIKQIVSNLMSNAIKFTPAQGHILVKFDLLEKTNDGLTIQGTVSDTGVGIQKEAHDFIFNMFSQADESTTRKYGGTGLGLAITKQLVELMGGSIRVESTEGKGSSFYFTLKLGLQISSDPPNDPTLKLMPNDLLKFKANILVVEDNELNQAVTRDMLAALGCKVDVANSGGEALDTLAKQKYDLILMDCHMPGLDGFITTRKIRELEENRSEQLAASDKKNIIVALTANALKGTKEKCLESGMNDYLTKPVHLKPLQAIMQKYLSTKQQK